MSDVDGGAAAPADATPVADTTTPVTPPNPVQTSPEGQPEPNAKPEGKPAKEEAKAEPAKPLSVKEALQKASDKVERDAKEPAKPEKGSEEEKKLAEKAKVSDEPKDTAKHPVKDDQPRGEGGKFASKDGEKAPAKDEPKLPSHTAGDPPARFSQDAKAKWAEAPESVRAEVSRMERELTQGYHKHREAAEAFEPVRKFHEIAVQSGTTLDKALESYYNTEQRLKADPVGGMIGLCRALGVDAKAVAQAMLGAQTEGQPQGSSPEVAALKNEIAELKQQIGGVAQTFQQRDTAAAVEKFASEHPFFDELEPTIHRLLVTKFAQNLPEAYETAVRLTPEIAAKIEAGKTAGKPAAEKDPAADAQTVKGGKSINGAPSPGSEPAARKPSNSVRESLERAFRASS